MQVNDVLADGFGRLPGLVRQAAEGLSPEQLVWAPAEGANTIGWLVWHLTRIQDHHISELLETEQIWAEPHWAPRFGLAPDPDDTGYSHTVQQVATVTPESAQALLDYHDAVAARTMAMLAEVTADGLDRIVDRRWNPPVTLGVRLVSVLGDGLEHVGQAAYVRGILPG